jgi:hypothetical protein
MEVTITSYSPSYNHLTHIREVILLPGEKVTHVFVPEAGLVAELPSNGQLLITTNQRIISFSQDHGHQETSLVPIEELKGITVKNDAHNATNLLQGLLLALGGAFAYLVIAYWLTGRFDGPQVPFLNLDLAPLLTLIAIVWGAVLIARYYFAREDNLVTFQGSNWVVNFPFRGNKAGQEIYQVVNTLFTTRRWRNGYSFLWEE